jgi:hypothetical protein
MWTRMTLTMEIYVNFDGQSVGFVSVFFTRVGFISSLPQLAWN